MDSEIPGTAGKYIRASRESEGLTIEQVSLITKIRAQYIKAIEDDDLSMFSSPQLLKGYVKLLAKTVKADDAEAVALLEAEAGENFKDKHIEDIVGERFKEELQRSNEFKKKALIIVLAGIFVIILMYASIKLYEYIKTAPKFHIVLPFKSSSKSIISKKPASVNGKPLTISTNYPVVLKGKVIKRTWVAVKIDGGITKTAMLHAGDVETWKAKKKLRIKIGNGGGIILNYNGKNIGKPGTVKQVVTLRFPRHAK